MENENNNELEKNGLISEDEIHDRSVKPVNMTKEVKKAFLDYAMSVIVSRALPDVRDGLKPVHRRIIHTMNELGVHAGRAHKKSARIVGDTMGKYHPHGDTAIYDALVRLAQDFSCRYPLVDGHGNFGSIDGDEAAAMRYTEARMSKIAMEMVRDIDEETVDFMDNYDGSEKEPVVLPCRFPNLLVNGTVGIAVGMATNVPTHNLGEVIDAVLAISSDPGISVTDLMNNYIPGPDFPTGGIILGRNGIKKAYEEGNGSIIVRSKCHFEDMEHGDRKRIIVTEIPYQVNKTVLIEKIVDLVKNKIVEGISDLRDESSREGMRIVIELKKGTVPEVILNQLYKLTQLQTTFGANMLAIVDGEPRVLGIKEILNQYLLHQEDVLIRRTKFRLAKANDKIHILQGLRIASDNIDEVLHIIRNSQTAEIATNELMAKFNLSEKQCKAILDMRLQRLTGLARAEIVASIEQLEIEIAELRSVLEDKNKLLEIIRTELLEMKSRYADARRTEITNDYSNIDDEDLIPQEDIVISLTINGYIKRVTTDTYRTQNRGGRGVTGMTTHEDDIVDQLLITNTHTDVLFFTNTGRVYRIRGYKIPEFSRQSKGLPIINLLNMDKKEKVQAMISIDTEDITGEEKLLFISKNGISKRVSIEEFRNIRQNGKIAVTLKDGDELFAVKKTNGNEDVIIAASNGKAVRFAEDNIRCMGRTATGVKSINVGDGEVVGASTSSQGEYVLVLTSKGYGKMSHIDEYRVMSNRGGKGVKTVNVTEKNGKLVCLKAVKGDEDLLVVTNKGVIIRVSLEQVKVASRNTQGVRIIKIADNSVVSSIAVVDKEEMIEEGNVTHDNQTSEEINYSEQE